MKKLSTEDYAEKRIRASAIGPKGMKILFGNVTKEVSKENDWEYFILHGKAIGSYKFAGVDKYPAVDLAEGEDCGIIFSSVKLWTLIQRNPDLKGKRVLLEGRGEEEERNYDITPLE